MLKCNRFLYRMWKKYFVSHCKNGRILQYVFSWSSYLLACLLACLLTYLHNFIVLQLLLCLWYVRKYLTWRDIEVFQVNYLLAFFIYLLSLVACLRFSLQFVCTTSGVMECCKVR